MWIWPLVDTRDIAGLGELQSFSQYYLDMLHFLHLTNVFIHVAYLRHAWLICFSYFDWSIACGISFLFPGTGVNNVLVARGIFPFVQADGTVLTFDLLLLWLLCRYFCVFLQAIYVWCCLRFLLFNLSHCVCVCLRKSAHSCPTSVEYNFLTRLLSWCLQFWAFSDIRTGRVLTKVCDKAGGSGE